MRKFFDINYVLDNLFKEKRVFVSEADFQFSLAWKIKELYAESEVRLEYVPYKYNKNIHLDIVAFFDKKMIPIELKYKTKKLKNEEKFNVYLKNQEAQDGGRYDFLKDIQRLEKLINISEYLIEEAYAIFLTNDSLYWTNSKKETVDKEFRLHNGISSGKKNWSKDASLGTKKSREKEITIRGDYRNIKWQNSQECEGNVFKSLVVKVNKKENV